MSEYQYYEFQAVDRPLTQNQMSDLRAYSSRAQIKFSAPRPRSDRGRRGAER